MPERPHACPSRVPSPRAPRQVLLQQVLSAHDLSGRASVFGYNDPTGAASRLQDQRGRLEARDRGDQMGPGAGPADELQPVPVLVGDQASPVVLFFVDPAGVVAAVPPRRLPPIPWPSILG